MSVLIAVPTYETIAPECFRAIYALKGDDISFDFVKGYDCAKARNDIARKALSGGYEYVLMIDSDIVVPDNALSLLMEHSPDICFGVYPRKNTDKGETELFKEGTFDFKNRYTFAELDEMDDRIKVKGGGFGCALVKTDVFNNLDYPWFNYFSYENDTYLSEDLAFCMIAQIRYRLEADTRVRCGHIGRQIQYN